MANPLSQAKDLYKMQAEARAMQSKMKQLVVEGSSKDGNITVKVNGLNLIDNIEIADELIDLDLKNKLVKGIKQAVKDANKKLQKEMMRDLDMGKLRSMLGN